VNDHEPLSNKFDLRRILKTGVANSLHWSGLDRAVGSLRGRNAAPFVVGYHRVVEDFKSCATHSMPSMLVSKDAFIRQLEWLGRHYDFVSLDELASIQQGPPRQGKPVAAVTFDDGYQDYYDNAFPILQRMGIPSAVFVVTNLVGTTQLLVHDELYWLFSTLEAKTGTVSANIPQGVVQRMLLPNRVKKTLLQRINGIHAPFKLTRSILETLGPSDVRAYIRTLTRLMQVQPCQLQEFRLMGWDALNTLVKNGVTVGSHTRTHALLDGEPATVVRRELEGSRLALEHHLGVRINHLAYPDGRFDAVVVREAAAAGYSTACTICGHQDQMHSLLTVSRKMLWEKSCMDSLDVFSPAIMSCQANGIFDPADKCQLQHGARVGSC
jgi:peptidoglycan/xylan/chitin deacetylase (PgdA/CDA1 family)